MRPTFFALTIWCTFLNGFALANEAPVATTAPGKISVAVHSPLTITGTSVNDRDGDLKEVELSVLNGKITNLTTSAPIIVSPSSSGKKLTITSSSSGITRQADLNTILTPLTYKGDPAFNGKDVLTVLARDDAGATHSAEIEIIVSDAPIITIPKPREVDEDMPLSLTGVSVKDETSDLTNVLVSVKNGKLSLTGAGNATITNETGSVVAPGSSNSVLKLGSTSAAAAAVQTDISDTLKTLTYKPNPNFAGGDILEVSAKDGAGSNSSASLEILVKEVSAKPACTSYKKASNEGLHPGDLFSQWSLGNVASYSLVNYNLADKKASLNSRALGFGPALRFYTKSQLKVAGTDDIANVPEACRAKSEDLLEYFIAPKGELPKIGSAISFAPTFYVFKDKDDNDLGTQLAFNLGFLNDWLTIGVGWNISGPDAGEWFFQVGPSFGIRF